MNDLLDILVRAKRARNPTLLTSAIPYARFLGITFDPAAGGDAGVVAKMAFSETLVGDPTVPALHGGTIGTLLESTAIFQLLWTAETVVIPKTINITIQYLRPAKLVDTFAQGSITKHGRRIANVRVEAWQSRPEQPIAVALTHFLIDPSDNPGGDR